MPRHKEGKKPQTRCTRLAKQIDSFLSSLPLDADRKGSDRKAVECLRELSALLKDRHAGGLRWARDVHIINWLAWKRILER